MSLDIHKWILKYFTGMAVEYGALDSRILPTKTKHKCQIVKFLTHLTENKAEAVPADNCIWAMLSDKQHQIPVRFAAEAVAEFANDPSYRGKRFTECTGAVIIISDFTPCFRRVPIREGDALSRESTLSLDVQTFKVKGSVGEGIWGKPQTLSKNSNLQEWMLEMAKPNGDMNVLKNRDRGIEMKAVHKSIDRFDAFPAKIATPSELEIAPETQDEPVAKPKAQRPKRTLDKSYNKTWKKLLGDARKSHDKACIPADVKARFAKPGPRTSIIITNRDAMNLSQATHRSISPPRTPELIRTTPPSEEWPHTQTEDDRDVLMEDASEREYSSSPAKNWESEPEDDEILPDASHAEAKVESLEEMPSWTAWMSPSSAAQRRALPKANTPVEPLKDIAPTEQANDEPNLDEFLLATASSGLISSLEGPTNLAAPCSPPTEVFKDQTNSKDSKRRRYHEANSTFSIPPPTPAQRVLSQITFSNETEPTLPSSSFPLQSPMNRTIYLNPSASPVAGPSRYADQVERKVAMPKQGPPMVAQRAKGPDGKMFTVLVPASDTSLSMSQSQPQPPSQSQPKSQLSSEVSGAAVLQETGAEPAVEDEPVVEGLNAAVITETPPSALPVVVPAVVEPEQVPDDHDSVTEDELDEDDVIVAKKLIHSSQVIKSPNKSRSPISEPSTRLSAVAKGKMREEPLPARKRKRSRSSQMEISSPTSGTSRNISLTHDPVAWRKPSFQSGSNSAAKEKEREVKVDLGMNSLVPDKNPAKKPEPRGPNPTAKLKDPLEKITTGRKRTASMMDPEAATDGGVKKKRRSARTEVLARHIPHESTKQQEQAVASEIPKQVTQQRKIMSGAKISFDLDPIEGISLVTFKSLGKILLHTGKIRNKQVKAKGGGG